MSSEVRGSNRCFQVQAPGSLVSLVYSLFPPGVEQLASLTGPPLRDLIPQDLPAIGKCKQAVRPAEHRPEGGAVFTTAAEPDGLPVRGRTEIDILPGGGSARLRPGGRGGERTPMRNELPGEDPLLRTAEASDVLGIPTRGKGRAVPGAAAHQDGLRIPGL